MARPRWRPTNTAPTLDFAMASSSGLRGRVNLRSSTLSVRQAGTAPTGRIPCGVGHRPEAKPIMERPSTAGSTDGRRIQAHARRTVCSPPQFLCRNNCTDGYDQSAGLALDRREIYMGQLRIAGFTGAALYSSSRRTASIQSCIAFASRVIHVLMARRPGEG